MLPSGLPEQVSDDEPLARFLTSRSQYGLHGPKANAYLPNPKDGKSSVFRHGDEPRRRLWQIGKEALGTRGVYGVAMLPAGAIRRVGLDVEADEPPPRHANIVGWPAVGGDPLLARAHRKELALRVAQQAELVLA